MAAEDKYYRSPERWDLYNAAIEQLRRLDPESVLELGPYRLPLVANGHTMDRRNTGTTTCVHDARQTPWPIAHHYDVFVALQVWEHLESSQRAAFSEVRRIASHALLSFPYRWNCPSNPSHHAITETTIREWTCGVAPASVTVIPSASDHRRILYHFAFT